VRAVNPFSYGKWPLDMLAAAINSVSVINIMFELIAEIFVPNFSNNIKSFDRVISILKHD